MNWTPIYSALAQAAALTGIPAAAIVWGDQPPVSTWIKTAKLTMAIKGLDAKGIDYEERVDGAVPPNAGNLPQVVTVVGQRQFVWSIKCEVQNADPATIGISYLDALRTRLQRTTTEIDILQPAGLAVVEMHPTASLLNVKNERSISTYVMDVLMACCENDVDTASDAGVFINTVVLSSNKLKTPDGVDAPVQINQTIVGP